MAENSVPPKRKQRGKGRPFLEGVSGNPGGRPPKLREIEAMLDAEHRPVDKMREVYETLRKVALGVKREIYWQGVVVGAEIEYSSSFMDLYLNRVVGPVKEIKADLSDAPEEVIAWLSEHLN